MMRHICYFLRNYMRIRWLFIPCIFPYVYIRQQISICNMDERHMEYKNNFQLLQHLLDQHPACRLLQPNRSFESISENIACLNRESCTGLQQINELFLRVSEYPNPVPVVNPDTTDQKRCALRHAS
jgi:hypothetical protein